MSSPEDHNNDEATTLDQSKKPSGPPAPVGLILFACLCINVCAISIFNNTVASWWTYAVVPLAYLALAIPIIGAIVISKRAFQAEQIKYWALYLHRPVLAYCLIFGFLPYWINSLSLSDTKEITVEATDVYEVTTTYESGGQSVSYDIYFDYNGQSFDFSQKNAHADSVISIHVATGCFGWEYIQDMKAK